MAFFLQFSLLPQDFVAKEILSKHVDLPTLASFSFVSKHYRSVIPTLAKDDKIFEANRPVVLSLLKATAPVSRDLTRFFLDYLEVHKRLSSSDLFCVFRLLLQYDHMDAFFHLKAISKETVGFQSQLFKGLGRSRNRSSILAFIKDRESEGFPFSFDYFQEVLFYSLDDNNVEVAKALVEQFTYAETTPLHYFSFGIIMGSIEFLHFVIDRFKENHDEMRAATSTALTSFSYANVHTSKRMAPEVIEFALKFSNLQFQDVFTMDVVETHLSSSWAEFGPLSSIQYVIQRRQEVPSGLSGFIESALRTGQVEIVRYFLSLGSIEINQDFLAIAVEGGSTECVELIYNANSDPSSLIPELYMRAIRSYGDAASTLKWLISKQCPMGEEFEKSGLDSALKDSVLFSSCDCKALEVLWKHGCRFQSDTLEEISTSEYLSLKRIKWLLEHGIKPSNELIRAVATSGNIGALRYLFNHFPPETSLDLTEVISAAFNFRNIALINFIEERDPKFLSNPKYKAVIPKENKIVDFSPNRQTVHGNFYRFCLEQKLIRPKAIINRLLKASKDDNGPLFEVVMSFLPILAGFKLEKSDLDALKTRLAENPIAMEYIKNNIN